MFVETNPETIDQVARALAGVPQSAYSVPHVYPSAAPAYDTRSEAERPRIAARRMRLYVHVPFCRYKCTYCYFSVKVGANRSDMQRYVRALEKELEWLTPGTELSQLYVGGGTPTALPVPLFRAALGAVFDRMGDSGRAVHTVETSPETISEGHIDVLHELGVRRISMGIQSLSETTLDKIARRQIPDQTLAACRLLVRSGLITNVDLIYGLPNQTPETFRKDLCTVAELGITGVTLYSLRTNERTPIRRVLQPHERFDLERLIAWRTLIEQTAKDIGFVQTRWHTFKKADSVALVHRRLPTFDRTMLGFQFGVGVSARSHLGHAVYRNHFDLDTYLSRVEQGRSPVEQLFPLDGQDLRTQFVARTLGDGEALSRTAYRDVFGSEIDRDYAEVMERLLRGDLVASEGDKLELTALGRKVYDLVTLAFYPERAKRWLETRREAKLLTLGSREHRTLDG